MKLIKDEYIYDSLDLYPEEFLACRDRNHWWDEEFLPQKTNPFNLDRYWFCTLCGARKVESMTWDGYVWKRAYALPKGYALNFAVTKLDLRQEYMRRRNIRLRKDSE